MNKWFTTILLFTNAALAGGLSPKEIMQKNDDARRVKEFETSARLSTGTEGGKETKVKEFTLWRKVREDGVHNDTLTRFHSPAEVRNEGILISENPSGRNDVLLYLPAYKKIRRVESQQQSGSFMGSVFSYSDIATPHVEDYHYKSLKDEKCPSTEAANIVCFVIEAIPSSDDIKERTGYSKSILWVRQDNFMFVKADYFNLDNELFKRMNASQIKIVDSQNKKWLAHQVSIVNLKTKEYTKLEFSNVKVNKGISPAIFTQQNLQKI